MNCRTDICYLASDKRRFASVWLAESPSNYQTTQYACKMHYVKLPYVPMNDLGDLTNVALHSTREKAAHHGSQT